MPELVEDISGWLLSLDVAEYLRFRAACKRWRQGTAGPRDGLDSRFRPRDWIVLSNCAAGTTRRRLLNLAAAARVDVDLPALSTHHHQGSADGLLVLCDRATEAVRLLNPLTGALTDFPPITEWVSVPPRCAPRFPLPSWCTDVVDHSMINDRDQLPLTSEVFTAEGIPRCVELLEVDLAARRLVPVRSLGRRAVFVGATARPHGLHGVVPLDRSQRCVHESLPAGVVWLQYLLPRPREHWASDRAGAAVQEFLVAKGLDVSPLHRPCSLADYLICYVDRIRMFYD